MASDEDEPAFSIPSPAAKPLAASNTILLRLTEHKSLNDQYMPFLKHGGLWVIKPTRAYDLGENVILRLMLPGEEDVTPVPARVIWIDPPMPNSQRPDRIGVHFMQDEGRTQQRIERCLKEAPIRSS